MGLSSISSRRPGFSAPAKVACDLTPLDSFLDAGRMLLTTVLSHVAVNRSFEGNSMARNWTSESHTVTKAKYPKWVPTGHTMACIVPRQPFFRHNSSACSHPACHLPMSIGISGCLLASTQNLQDQHDSKWSLARSQSCVGTFKWHMEEHKKDQTFPSLVQTSSSQLPFLSMYMQVDIHIQLTPSLCLTSTLLAPPWHVLSSLAPSRADAIK